MKLIPGAHTTDPSCIPLGHSSGWTSLLGREWSLGISLLLTTGLDDVLDLRVQREVGADHIARTLATPVATQIGGHWLHPRGPAMATPINLLHGLRFHRSM